MQKQLWEVEDVSYEQSRRLLQETEVAVWLLDNAGGAMDFSGLDTVAVRTQDTVIVCCLHVSYNS
jgi:hypothetical protein